MRHAEIGVIGGSGLYSIDGLTDVQSVEIETPFGAPSDALTLGTVNGVALAFLPRHGRGHRLLPSEVPSRANIFAMRTLGVRQIVSASAVGSLREDLRPMDMVIPDGLYDRTKGRPSTFFGDGIVAHIAFAHPFCAAMRDALLNAAWEVVERAHDGGAYVCIEGPAFSTLTESESYRHQGFSIIGMTALPEAKLAREAGICYAVLAQVTDYDCWHPDHESVTNDMVMANVARNVVNARAIIERVVPALHGRDDCSCRHALEGAIATDPSVVPVAARERLAPILVGTRLA